ncbi:LamG-like jellyroll fold domain-containing protein, partial [Patescibacteria group bacterium]
WHHFSAVKTGTSSIALYVDGESAGTDASLAAATSMNSSGRLHIGVDSDGTSHYYKGNLDELIIYPYARSTDQIKSDALGGQTSMVLGAKDEGFLSDGLVGYWKMDGGTFDGTADYGETSITATADSGNGDLVVSQKVEITQPGTVESLTFYVTTAAGDLYLGLYDDNNDFPGNLVATTSSFTPGTGWNTEATATNPEIEPGTYWLVYHPSSSSLAFRRDATTGTTYWYSKSYGALDSTFQSTGLTNTTQWSFYTTIDVIPEAFNDETINNNDGTPSGDVTTTTGKFGGAISVDGSGDYVSTNVDLSSAKTISAWVKANSFPNTWNVPLDTGSSDGLIFSANSGGTFYARQGGSSEGSSSNNSLSTGTWYHVVGTYVDGTYSNLYINGEKQAGSSQGAYAGSGNTTIGSWSEAGNGWDGVVDEVRIYNRALSANEVKALYQWAPGPVAYWNLDENTGTTVYDKSGNNNVSTGWSGDTTWATGKFGSGLYFDGTNDVVRFAETTKTDIGAVTDSFTISTWMKTTKNWSGENGGLVGKRASSGAFPFSLSVAAGNDPAFMIGDGTNTPEVKYATEINDSTWHYITAIRDVADDMLYLYVDGILRDSTTDTTTTSLVNDQDISIGNYGTSYDGVDFEGFIDDVKIYNYARTPSQILEDMNAGHPLIGSPVGSPAVHLKFDEGYGSTANDSSPNGNDGTLGTGDSSPSWSLDGKYSKSLYFDQSGDYIDVSGYSISDYPFTFSVWTKLAVAGADTLISLADETANTVYYTLGYQGGGTSSATLEARNTTIYDIDDTQVINDGQWHHLVGTFASATDRKLYVDGKLKGSDTNSVAFNTNATTLNIGRRATLTPAGYMYGNIDEVKVYNTALTADQVKQEYQGGKAQVLGSVSTDGSGNASWSSERSYCPPGDTTNSCAPVAEWKFDEKTGTTAYDTAGSVNTGTLTNGPAWRSANECYQGACLFFDGASGLSQNDYVNAGSDSSIDDIFDGGGTVTFWVNPYSAGEASTARIITKGGANNGWTINKQPCDANNVDLNMAVDSTGTDAQFRADCSLPRYGWSHVAVTYDDDSNSNSPSFYVNGSVVTLDLDDTGDTAYASDAGNNLYIGNNSITAGTFDGLIDEIKMYDYVLSPAQIAWNYNKGGPVGWWKFDECSGTTAYDSSGKGNNGTISADPQGSNTSVGS